MIWKNVVLPRYYILKFELGTASEVDCDSLSWNCVLITLSHVEWDYSRLYLKIPHAPASASIRILTEHQNKSLLRFYWLVICVKLNETKCSISSISNISKTWFQLTKYTEIRSISCVFYQHSSMFWSPKFNYCTGVKNANIIPSRSRYRYTN